MFFLDQTPFLEETIQLQIDANVCCRVDAAVPNRIWHSAFSEHSPSFVHSVSTAVSRDDLRHVWASIREQAKEESDAPR
jgi:hypothetical protein